MRDLFKRSVLGDLEASKELSKLVNYPMYVALGELLVDLELAGEVEKIDRIN